MEVRKAVKTVGIYWLSIGFLPGYIYPGRLGAAKDTVRFSDRLCRPTFIELRLAFCQLFLGGDATVLTRWPICRVMV